MNQTKLTNILLTLLILSILFVGYTIHNYTLFLAQVYQYQYGQAVQPNSNTNLILQYVKNPVYQKVVWHDLLVNESNDSILVIYSLEAIFIQLNNFPDNKNKPRKSGIQQLVYHP